MSLLTRSWRYFTGYFWTDLAHAWTDFRRADFGFAAAGLRSRFSPSKRVTVPVNGVGPVMVRPRDSDFETLRQIFRDNGYGMLPRHVQTALQERYQAILAAGKVPVIVDAGANIGAASVWFKNRYPQAAIVAIEPEPANAALARANVAGLDKVEVVEAAIGSEPGHVAIVDVGDSYGFRTERSEAGCAVVTITDCVARVPGGVLFIAKIDIEGFEGDLFEQNIEWIDEALLVYVEPHEWMLPGARSSSSFQRAFGQRDFALHLSGENLVYVRN